MTDQQDKQQIIIEGLITTLGYREQKINELESENIAWKARAEIAERRVKFLLERIDKLGGTVIDTEAQNGETKS